MVQETGVEEMTATGEAATRIASTAASLDTSLVTADLADDQEADPMGTFIQCLSFRRRDGGYRSRRDDFRRRDDSRDRRRSDSRDRRRSDSRDRKRRRSSSYKKVILSN